VAVVEFGEKLKAKSMRQSVKVPILFATLFNDQAQGMLDANCKEVAFYEKLGKADCRRSICCQGKRGM